MNVRKMFRQIAHDYELFEPAGDRQWGCIYIQLWGSRKGLSIVDRDRLVSIYETTYRPSQELCAWLLPPTCDEPIKGGLPAEALRLRAWRALASGDRARVAKVRQEILRNFQLHCSWVNVS